MGGRWFAGLGMMVSEGGKGSGWLTYVAADYLFDGNDYNDNNWQVEAGLGYGF